MKPLRNAPYLKSRRRELRHNQTEAEKLFWQKVRGRRFLGLKFFRQYSVGPYIVDFYCPKLKLAIELDGGQHAQVDRRKHDVAREMYLKMAGVEVLRFWDNEVLKNMDGVLYRLMEIVKSKGLF